VSFDRLSATDGIQGVIGQDALAAVRYTIDFRRRELLWWPEEGAVARGMSFTLEGGRGRFLISHAAAVSNTLRLVPDSGAGTLLLFDPSNRLPLTLLGQHTMLTTMSAQGTVRLARMRELQVGTAMLQDVAAVCRRGETRPKPRTPTACCRSTCSTG
jgi:hypothetical protein